MLKPLKGLLQISKTKVILNSLFMSIKYLKTTMFFLLIYLFVYANIGVSIFKGVLETRCRTNPLPPTNHLDPWAITPTPGVPQFICGYKSCPAGSHCLNAHSHGLPYESNHISIDEFNFGITSFDNIWWAILTMFEILVGEGWVKILYIYWNAMHPFVAMLYFNSAIFFGTIFMLNMVLGVISYTFSKVTEEDRQREMTPMEIMAQIMVGKGKGTRRGRKEIRKLKRAETRKLSIGMRLVENTEYDDCSPMGKQAGPSKFSLGRGKTFCSSSGGNLPNFGQIPQDSMGDANCGKSVGGVCLGHDGKDSYNGQEDEMDKELSSSEMSSSDESKQSESEEKFNPDDSGRDVFNIFKDQ
jgi:hypothetical protein